MIEKTYKSLEVGETVFEPQPTYFWMNSEAPYSKTTYYCDSTGKVLGSVKEGVELYVAQYEYKQLGSYISKRFAQQAVETASKQPQSE